MRVGIIVMGNNVGGVEKRFAHLFSFLQSNHRTCSEFCLFIPEGLLAKLRNQRLLVSNDRNIISIFRDFPYSIYSMLPEMKVRGRRVPGTTLALLPLWRRELKRLQSSFAQFDILHFCSPNPVLLMPKGVPVLLEEPNSMSARKINPMVFNWLSKGSYISCLTESIADAYKRRISHPALLQKIFVAPCSFTDYSRISVSSKERTIVFMARMEKIKNPVVFIDAIEILSRKRSDFNALMLGSGNMDRLVDNLIVKKGLNAIMSRFYSVAPQQILSKAAVFVSLQEYDNYPSQALLEAMASGCAVIASDRGETRKLVTEDVGFCVPLSAAEIAERLDQMLDQFDRTVEMGMQAREKVLREHTIHRYAGYLLNVYEIMREREKFSRYADKRH